MNTGKPIKVSVQEAINRGYKKVAIARQIGISRQTFDTRLKDNRWQNSEISALKSIGIL